MRHRGIQMDLLVKCRALREMVIHGYSHHKGSPGMGKLRGLMFKPRFDRTPGDIRQIPHRQVSYHSFTQITGRLCLNLISAVAQG